MKHAEAAQVLLERRAARRSLMDFCAHIFPGYQRARHLCVLAEHLEAFERHEIKRLIISMPPQHGKSLMTSVAFPLWALGRNPEALFAIASYSAELAKKHSRTARERFLSPRYRNVFPAAAPGDSTQSRKSAHEWGTAQGGGYYAVGVGGSLTGRPVTYGIIDDPHKGFDEANSLANQEQVYNWYLSVFLARQPRGICLMNTRWSPNDLQGRLLRDMAGGGDQWTILTLPALDEQGAPLWPERYSLEDYLARKAADPKGYIWNAVYQQRPTIQGGNMFKADRIDWVREEDCPIPQVTRYVRFWDLASSRKQVGKPDPDYTAGCLMAVTGHNEPVPHVWVKNLVAGQWEAPERNRMILATAMHDGDGVPIGIEQVGTQKDTVTTMREILFGVRSVLGIPVSQDKVTRANPLLPICEAGHLHVVDGAHRALFAQQVAAFPAASEHDDLVDALSGAYGMLKVSHSMPDATRMGAGRAIPTAGGW
jgi:predicted phage terminase large subunit-like protein